MPRGESEMNRSVVALAYAWNRTQNARVGAAELSHQPITDLAPTHRGKLRMGGAAGRARGP